MGAHRSRRPRRLACLGAAVAAACLALAPAASATGTASWAPPVTLHGASSVSLGSATSSNPYTSCWGSGACAGIGTYQDHDGNTRSYLDTEVGGVWGHARDVTGVAAGAVDVEVSGLSCGGDGSCVAIGYFDTTADEDFFGGGTPFLDEETAGSWQPAIVVPGLASLAGVGAAALDEVSCAAPGNCAVSGTYYAKGTYPAFVDDERDGVWGDATEVPGLAAAGLSSSSLLEAPTDALFCVSAGNCVLGGYLSNGYDASAGYVAAETAGTWGKATQLPGLAALDEGDDALVGTVSCSSPGNCSVGGTYADGNGAPQAFVDSEASGSWGDAEEVPGTGLLNTGGGEVNELQQTVGAQVQTVDCPADGDCTIVGWYQTLAGASDLFVDSETAGSWGTATAMPGLAALNAGSTLQNDGAAAAGLACTGVGDCVVAGNYDDASGSAQLFTEQESGGTFETATELPGSGALTGTFANAFADSVNTLTCWDATGCALSGLAGPGGVLDAEDAGTWATVATFTTSPTVYVGTNAYVGLLSCPTAGSCAALGSFETPAGDESTYFSQQVAGAWGADVDLTGLDALSPSGVSIDAFDCAAVGSCTLLGTYVGADDVTHLFSDAEVAGTWEAPRAIGGLPAVAKGALPFLDNGPRVVSVSCPSAERCVGVGTVVTGEATEIPFLVTDAYGRWSVSLHEPGSTLTGTHELTDVSCPTPGNCVATGTDLTASGTREPFTAAESSGTWGAAHLLKSPLSLSSVTGKSAAAFVQALTCTAVRTCEATGFVVLPHGVDEPFVTSEIAGTWRAATFLPGFDVLAKQVPRSAYWDIVPSSLTCPNGNVCTLVGTYPVDYENDFGDLSASFVLSSLDGHWSTLALLKNPKATKTAKTSSSSDFSASGLACTSTSSCLLIGVTTTTTITRVSSDEWVYTYTYALAGSSGFGASFATPKDVGERITTYAFLPLEVDSVACGPGGDVVGACAAGGALDNGTSTLPFVTTAP